MKNPQTADLKQAIDAQESLHPTLGDAVVDAEILQVGHVTDNWIKFSLREEV
jgi:hypothetical protein